MTRLFSIQPADMERSYSSTASSRYRVRSRFERIYTASPILALLFGILILSLLPTVQCTDSLHRQKVAGPADGEAREPRERSIDGIPADSLGAELISERFATTSGILVDTPLEAMPFGKRTAFSYPRAFDTSIGTNFSSTTCPKFFDRFLSDQRLADCIPISLMLQNSQSFFQATQSKPDLDKVLTGACAVTFPVCNAIMNSYASEILSPSNCLNDYDQSNPIVVQAYAGFVSYKSLFKSTCTKNKDPRYGGYDRYCFTNAVTNKSSPTSSYVYYLPLGVNLPAGATPTCNWCLQRTMADFASYASNSSLPIALTYPSAATNINIMCGPNFVQANIKITSEATKPHNSKTWISTIITLIVMLVFL